jgi:hypothetical protein
MSVSWSRSRSVASRRRTNVVLACLLVSGCAAARPTDETDIPSSDSVDWLNRTYVVTCDGVVPDGFRATVVDGSARVLADGSRPPHYDHYDVRITATVSGDVDGDGASDGVVLLDCSPQPSNGVVQEVQVFSSTGRPLGALPSPRTLEGEAPLPPVYDPGGLSVEDGEIVAAMTAYGPDDVHATGPSVPLTVRWRFDGQDLVRVS